MFGQNNNHNDDNSAQIPDQSIDGALNDQPVAVPDPSWGHPGRPLDSTTAPADDTAQPETFTNAAPAVVAPVTNQPSDGSEDDSSTKELIDIKQQALSQLAPLVDHLDQSPEERFRTTMMMIQASDNHTLIKDAYSAAQAITDEKARAQALLDIVNEINYFTQHAEQ